MSVTALEELTVTVDPAWEALAANETAASIYTHQEELSVLNPDAGQRRDRFYEVVDVTPLILVPRDALPADLQETSYVVAVKNDGAQKGGAYKLRGTTNRLLDEDRDNIVGAASTGNHAKETAIAANALGFAGVEIDCPEDTVLPKKKAMTDNGAVVHDHHKTLPQSLQAARDRAQHNGGIFVHPYDDLYVVAGQGTITLEAVAQLQAAGFDGARTTFLYPGGGGGIGAGNGVAAKMNWPGAEVRIAQMYGTHGIAAELAGETFDPAKLDKSCDGAAVPVPGRLAMEVISDPAFVDSVDVVTKAELGEAMAVLAKVHTVPEPAGALAMAATLKYMRQNCMPVSEDVPHVLVPVTTGVQVTPEKVSEFMKAAYSEGLIDGPTAFATVSQAHGERYVSGLDEILAENAAEGRVFDPATYGQQALRMTCSMAR